MKRGNNSVKSIVWGFLVVSLMWIGAGSARADTVTYTFVGAEGTAGTDWTLVDTNGYLTVPSGNVIDLVQTATDLILVDPMTGPEDLGPLTNISANYVMSQPDYYGISMGSSSFTLSALEIPKVDFTTPGTYELADFVEVEDNLPANQGTLTITATPEPISAGLMLSGVVLALIMLTRKSSAIFS